MKLCEIINDVAVKKIIGTTDSEIFDICYDSRKVSKGCVFVCLKGANFDGHDYAEKAYLSGACAIISQEEMNIDGATIVIVEDTRKCLAEISANFFGNPAEKLITIGITGTKGKTTTSFMIKSILESSGAKCGLIGTLGAYYGDNHVKLDNTTPESYEIQKNLSEMVKLGCKYAVMEASSIGLKTHRLDGFEFDIGVFTNFSHDHIGGVEHKDMEEYLECKSLLFKKCKKGIINADDESAEKIISGHTCEICTYGKKKVVDYGMENIRLDGQNSMLGISVDIKGKLSLNDVFVASPGEFNAYNALAACATCDILEIDEKSIRLGLKNVKVKGRMEHLDIGKDYSVFIDYAHNAVSMENVLTTLRQYSPHRLTVIFGAGGNRPKIRRYEMGKTAGKLADFSVITSDNPRNEDPMDIINDIVSEISKTKGKYKIIPDRREAIEYGIKNAQNGDIIVLAGKGHEDYQEIRGVKYPMDERKIVKDILESL